MESSSALRLDANIARMSLLDDFLDGYGPLIYNKCGTIITDHITDHGTGSKGHRTLTAIRQK